MIHPNLVRFPPPSWFSPRQRIAFCDCVDAYIACRTTGDDDDRDYHDYTWTRYWKARRG